MSFPAPRNEGNVARHRRRFVRRSSLVGIFAVVSSGCAVLTPGTLVDVDGHKLRIQCKGQGSPAVVMENGLGDALETWDEVVPGVAKVTRVCAYDRAGIGGSESGPFPRTSAQIIKELHTLLVRALVPRPYVLVGHSFGGLNVRLFAAQYPSEVGGIVLVDSTHESYPLLESRLRTSEEMSRIRTSLQLARPAARSEYDSLAMSADQVRSAGPLPDVPVIVITAGAWENSAPLRDTWMKLQQELCEKVRRCRQIVADDSSHYVQFDRPDLVVGAIREVVEQSRRDTAP